MSYRGEHRQLRQSLVVALPSVESQENLGAVSVPECSKNLDPIPAAKQLFRRISMRQLVLERV